VNIQTIVAAAAAALSLASLSAAADETPPRLFMDEHRLDSVTAQDVAAAHLKDLAVQNRFGVNFKRYWVDEENSRVYCLAEAPDAKAVVLAHSEAHGLVPQEVHEVAEGSEEAAPGDLKLFMDVHRVGPGEVTAEEVARAHEKDLAVQGRYGVHFINYWVDPDSGDIFCLSRAKTADDVLAVHREAHGLVSNEISEVIQGE